MHRCPFPEPRGGRGRDDLIPSTECILLTDFLLTGLFYSSVRVDKCGSLIAVQMCSVPCNADQMGPIPSPVCELCWERYLNLFWSILTSFNIFQVTSLIRELSKMFDVCSFCKSQGFALSKTILQPSVYLTLTLITFCRN